MKKRGFFRGYKTSSVIVSESLFKLITFALIFAIAVFFAFFLKTLYEGTIFEKRMVSKDLSLLITTIQGSPGDIEYSYQDKTGIVSKFDYLFSDMLYMNPEVTVFETGNSDQAEKYPYITKENLRKEFYQRRISKPTKITITKSKEGFSIK